MYRRRFIAVVAVLTVVVLIVGALALLGRSLGPVFSDTLSNFQSNQPLDGAPSGAVALPSVTAAALDIQGEAASRALSIAPSPAAMPTSEPTLDAMTFDDPGTNPFYDTEDDALSTFAMDVDTASYTVARNYLLTTGQMPPPDAIRPEEFVNYFRAGYDSPTGDEAFAIVMDAAPAPFGYEGHYLLRVGVQGRYIAPEDRAPALLIFVIDVSGSMDREDRLGTVKESLAYLVDELREDDRVGIVVYSERSRVVLEPTSASDKATIMRAIDALQPEGSTNAEEGLRLGYALANEARREGENTRVILLSDGVANVGNTGPDAILNTIRSGIDQGVTLTTIGFGMGNYNDMLMEQLANDGDGNYFYVDTLREARRVFVHNLTGTLQVIGYDAKIQVAFNPEVVDRYRLIGYENRAIADQDFRNDSVDAGEVGAGHSVTALYELALEEDAAQFIATGGVAATAYIRYQDAETREVVEQNADLSLDDLAADWEAMPDSFRVQAAAAEFAELLRGSIWAEGGSYGEILRLLDPVTTAHPDDEDVAELVALVRTAIRYGDQ
jgi:Ca-activated chloride channel family protein